MTMTTPSTSTTPIAEQTNDSTTGDSTTLDPTLEHETGVEEFLDDIEVKILSTLEVTPYITRGMVQIALSPAMPPKLWAPILDKLVTDGKVLYVEAKVESPSGRSLTKGIYYLPKFPYPPFTHEMLGEFEATILLK